jgi:hypothetical protein
MFTSPPLVSILSYMNPVHIIKSYISKIYLNIISCQYLGLPSGFFPSGFYHQKHIHSLLMRATWFVHLILLDFIILLISGEERKLWSFLLCSFLNLLPLHRSSVQIFASTPSSQTSSVYVLSLMSETKFYTPTNKIIVLYILTLVFFGSRQEDTRSWTEMQQALTELICP